ncbi:unnamed protein product [Moneuplotes crassus]|uniref:Uncharacterized protein n=1 Tax=Euplotes crassus TaxID=5936 RepID=A0AAD1Y997_EUPCR|nr:unnamed protein product [Moneuplotes crassus]
MNHSDINSDDLFFSLYPSRRFYALCSIMCFSKWFEVEILCIRTKKFSILPSGCFVSTNRHWGVFMAH